MEKSPEQPRFPAWGRSWLYPMVYHRSPLTEFLFQFFAGVPNHLLNSVFYPKLSSFPSNNSYYILVYHTCCSCPLWVNWHVLQVLIPLILTLVFQFCIWILWKLFLSVTYIFCASRLGHFILVLRCYRNGLWASELREIIQFYVFLAPGDWYFNVRS